MIIDKNQYFHIKVRVDPPNHRLWVEHYFLKQGDDSIIFLLDYMSYLIKRFVPQKVIFPCADRHAEQLSTAGYSQEGFIKGYMAGEDACFMTFYTDTRRKFSNDLEDEAIMLQGIYQRPELPKSSNEEFSLEIADKKTINLLSDLFAKVFTSYPTPIDDSRYLCKRLEQEDLFYFITSGDRAVSAASAEVDYEQGRAELTDCATLPAFRGQGLMERILKALGESCREKNINCIYSLARAKSFGMNLILHRTGYKYGGTLIKNCRIYGDFEDMNIWFKP